MRIKDEFPNYLPALMFYIGDKNPVKSSDDNKVLSYFLGLKNFKKGFDYYELTRTKDGCVFFSVVTMLGFKTILKTETQIEWQKLIGNYSNSHLMKEEYRALAQGYVKKGGGSSGCLGVLILGILMAGLFFLNSTLEM